MKDRKKEEEEEEETAKKRTLDGHILKRGHQYCKEVVPCDHFRFSYSRFKRVTILSLNRLKPHFFHFPLLPPIMMEF